MSETTADTLPAEQDEKEESMEELKMLDEDENETDEVTHKRGKEAGNAEDFLGTESLVMSDSENESPRKKQSSKEEITIDDHKAQNGNVVLEAVETLNNNADVNIKPKKRMIIDSDDDDDDNDGNVVNSNEDATIKVQNLKKKFANICDSESETEAVEDSAHDDKKNKHEMKSNVQTEHVDDDGLTEFERKLKKKYADLIDSDTEPEPEASDTERNNVESSEETPANAMEDEPQSKSTTLKRAKKPIRASAKKAMDDMQNIQSEQQRLHREAFISVPYHVPKKYTLKEFLNRRTIIKPKLHGEGSPAAAVVKAKSLKMNSEELAEYAKLMEERVKEATEFFKSESESENEDKDEYTNSCTTPKSPTKMEENGDDVKDVKDEERMELSHEEQQEENDTKTDDINSNVPTHNTLDDATDLDLPNVTEDVPLLTSQPIITEVVELPKLDLSTIHVTPDRKANKTPAQSKKSESIKCLIDEHKLASSPSLHGDPDMLIDLESGDLVQKAPTGVDNLLQRLMATKARKRKAPETVSILSTENGKLEMSKVHVHNTEETDPNVEHKPGAAFFKLKDNLKSLIKRKRLEELQKKQDDEREHIKCLEEDDDELDEFEPENKPKSVVGDDDEEEIENECDMDNEYEDEEEDEIQKNIDRLNELVADDDVAHESNDEGNEEESDSVDDGDDDDSNGIQLETNKEENAMRKNRIIAAFQDDSDDDVDLLKTQQVDLMKAAPLCDLQTQKSPTENMQELLALCSGKFDETQKTQNDAIISQMPITQHKSMQEHAEELLDLCSGTFETQKPEIPTTDNDEPKNKPTVQTGTKILSSDDENDNDKETNTNVPTQRSKKLTKRMKKRTKKLGFSDDEDEDEPDGNDGGETEEEDIEAAGVEEPETFVDYDSEENEIIVQMTKKDCVKEANKFFEQEAELSESDWGSADEDEKNMDRYDIELGDEDEFDREKLRDELGQIHARKMLDEDIREVRKFQEMFMADEEEDGVQRVRQFKWKNAESGFSLDESRKENEGDANGHDSADEENEQLWRKIRFEREQVLLEQNQKDELSSNVYTLSTANTITSANKKLNIIMARKSTTSVLAKNSSPFLITQRHASSSVTLTNTPMPKNIRGSFLVRDRATLDKLANMTKGSGAPLSTIGGIASTSDDTAGTVSVKTIKPKNFVFATLTEEEHENMKRKADDLMNSSSENGINYMKKPKMEPRRTKCLIDQLL